jgi:hypothetical protein
MMDDLVDLIEANPNQGARCSQCGKTANACKAIFLRAILFVDEATMISGKSAQGAWCCEGCRRVGPAAAHTITDKEQ